LDPSPKAPAANGVVLAKARLAAEGAGQRVVSARIEGCGDEDVDQQIARRWPARGGETEIHQGIGAGGCVDATMDALPYSGAVTCKWVRENDIGETSLPNIMRAKKKPIVTTPDALGVDVA